MLQTHPVIGRDGESAAIAELLDRVPERGGALILRGEAGIGKSTLLGQATRSAAERGMRVLGTAGVQSETHLPFAGLHQLLLPVLDHVDALPAPHRDALLAAFGMCDAAAPDLFRIALAALELIGDAASTAPVLLAVEDAHWLDPATADVLAFVARRLESEPVVLLAAMRDTPGSPLDAAGLPELALEGLDAAAAAELLEHHAPGLDAAVRERLFAEAAGNPLALVELPVPFKRHEAELSEWLPLTARLERAFAARESELPEATRRVLLLAAVDDGGVLAEVLAAAGETLEVFEPAVAARLIEIDGRRVRFRHPLMRSAIHQSAGPARRQAAHAALAEALAGQPERRVWHRAAAVLGTDEEVAEELEVAAALARRRGDIVAAVAALERAAGVTPASARRAGRLLRAAALGVELGRRELVDRLLEAVDPLDLEPVERGRIAWIRGMIDPAIPAEPARAALVDAADLAHREGDDELALNLLWLVASRSFWSVPGEATRRSIAQAAERVGRPQDSLLVLGILAYVTPREHGPLVLDALDRAAAADAGAARLLGTAAHVIGAFDRSGPHLAAAAADLRAQGRLGHLARLLVLHAWGSTYVGEWDVAIPAAAEARRLAEETGQPVWGAGADLLLALLAALRGDHDRAREYAAASEQAVLPMGAAFVLAAIQLARALDALGAGRHADAFEALLRVWDPADPSHHPFMRAWMIADLAEAAAHSGQRERGMALLEELEGSGLLLASTYPHAAAAYARAVLAEGEVAAELFQAALGPEVRRWPFLRARVLLAYGAWLRRERRVAESRAPLRAAREAFDALGAGPWSERARQELRASGETSRRRATEVRDELTPQELQIAQLAAGGLSNREIGQTLYLSHRTVGSHLYRIFPKLGITSRAELAGVLGAS